MQGANPAQYFQAHALIRQETTSLPSSFTLEERKEQAKKAGRVLTHFLRDSKHVRRLVQEANIDDGPCCIHLFVSLPTALKAAASTNSAAFIDDQIDHVPLSCFFLDGNDTQGTKHIFPELDGLFSKYQHLQDKNMVPVAVRLEILLNDLGVWETDAVVQTCACYIPKAGYVTCTDKSQIIKELRRSVKGFSPEMDFILSQDDRALEHLLDQIKEQTKGNSYHELYTKLVGKEGVDETVHYAQDMMERMMQRVRSCATCQKVGFGLKKCGSCKTTYYCSVDCQKGDWKDHRVNCGKK